MIKTVISIYCILSNIKLSENEVKALSYFVLYGITDKTKKLIVESGIYTMDSLRNSMSRFRNFNLITKSDLRRKEDYLSSDLTIPFDNIIGLMIKIDNT